MEETWGAGWEMEAPEEKTGGSRKKSIVKQSCFPETNAGNLFPELNAGFMAGGG